MVQGTKDVESGPALVSRFKDEIEIRGHQNKVLVHPCSHIGGHKYARNVIIFRSDNHGKVTGHWYGYVMPDDVSTLLEQHVEKGEIVDFLWSHADGTNVEDTGCCQTNSSSACCRSSNPPSENAANLNLDTKSMAEKRKGKKNPISVNGGNKSAPTPHKVCTMPTWLETWESEDVYAALALIGAAVSVAVAYNCYRQLG